MSYSLNILGVSNTAQQETELTIFQSNYIWSFQVLVNCSET